MGERDRCKGVLLGLAAGDRNGGPVRMALRLAESLADHRCFERADVMSRYVRWRQSGAFDTGPVSWSTLGRVAEGEAISVAVAAVHRSRGKLTAGCNPAHRAAPLAMLSTTPDTDLAIQTLAEASLTHFDPLAGEVAVVVVKLCRALVRGAQWDEALAWAVKGRDPEALALIGQMPLDPGGYAPAALAAALHFMTLARGFGGALRPALRFAGAANYCPVLVGALAGARWGASAVPAEMIPDEALLMRLDDVADALAQGW